jgi:hypothetical protein
MTYCVEMFEQRVIYRVVFGPGQQHVTNQSCLLIAVSKVLVMGVRKEAAFVLLI